MLNNKLDTYFDSHCHLDFNEFDHNRSQVLANCERLRVSSIFVPGISESGWQRQLAIIEQQMTNVSLHYGFGLHPYFLNEHDSNALECLETMLATHQPLAVGEIGLDFMLDENGFDKQYRLLQKQLVIAKIAQLPVVLHIRKAYDQVLKLLRQVKLKEGGIVHAFAGSEQQAKHFIELGFKLGFGGAVTYTRASKLRKLVTCLSLENIVLETDAPDMLPSFVKTGCNSPENIPKIAEIIAGLREIDVGSLTKQTTQNTKQAFNIK
ncbi:TatD family hydrolase [Endozoicomonas sp. SM1973]|uniref:TatD family hydrolase n=1 Tax=Spartinivicinus marinus TaxID=2994442 RepID=A0A853I0U9_9GAMM|nr:TatD family hydrolase [Spartinivicinus marinus]MCX4028085.1 TatD family hydrolase [Spartinivicinus marinus]NYZ66239.1 TatD family hydrolase [Spartinivicinus marinus]